MPNNQSQKTILLLHYKLIRSSCCYYYYSALLFKWPNFQSNYMLGWCPKLNFGD